METLHIALIIATSLFALIFIITRVLIGGLAGVITKTLASLAFVSSSIIGLATTNSPYKLVIALISIGLLFGMIGDILLDLKVIYDNDKFYLNYGMLSFGLGHISYFSAFTILAIKLNVNPLLSIGIAIGSAIIITILIMCSSKTMKLDFGNFKIQTGAYTFVLSFMTIYTLVLFIAGGVNLLTFIGLLLFFLSDIVLSFQYFGGKIKNKPLIVLNHTLYYAAQIVILSVTFLI